MESVEEIMIYLCEMEDERQEWKVVHKLSDIVFIVMMALRGNADDWHEIEIFCQCHEKLLKRYVPLENGIPSHDTMQRVFSSIKPESMQRITEIWNKLLDTEEGEKIKKILSIDGKNMRGNGNRNQEALHVVSAWSKERGVCFGQKSADSKGKEIPMILNLLDFLSLKNQVCNN